MYQCSQVFPFADLDRMLFDRRYVLAPLLIKEKPVRGAVFTDTFDLCGNLIGRQLDIAQRLGGNSIKRLAIDGLPVQISTVRRERDPVC